MATERQQQQKAARQIAERLRDSGTLSGPSTVTAHAIQHENGGADEISVAGLSGLLADAQTPLGHNTSHQSGGGDAIKLDDLAAPDDNTDLDATVAAHGLLPKLSGNSAQYLDGTGVFAVPPETAITDLNGDVVANGPGSATAVIQDGVVSYAKIQDVSATDKLLGRATAGAGSVEEIDCTPFARTILDDVDGAAVRATIGAGTGDGTVTSVGGTAPITSSGGDTPSLSLDTNGVGDTHLRQGAAQSVIGRSAGSTGNVADIAGANNQVLRVGPFGTLAFGSINLGSSAAVTGTLQIVNGGTGALSANQALNNFGILRAIVTSDFISTAAGMTAVTGMTVTVEAGTLYHFECDLQLTGGDDEATASRGIDFDFDGGTATITAVSYGYDRITGTTSNSVQEVTSLATDITDSITGTKRRYWISGYINVNAAGTIVMRIKPNVGSGPSNGAADPTVHAGSWMRLTRAA